jgi:hypothetical protein
MKSAASFALTFLFFASGLPANLTPSAPPATLDGIWLVNDGQTTNGVTTSAAGTITSFLQFQPGGKYLSVRRMVHSHVDLITINSGVWELNDGTLTVSETSNENIDLTQPTPTRRSQVRNITWTATISNLTETGLDMQSPPTASAKPLVRTTEYPAALNRDLWAQP